MKLTMEGKMSNIFQREEMLIGKEALNKLNNAKVAVVGIGGVGSYVVEGLARAGIGKLVLVDKDVVEETNINRQLVALQSTIGLPKVEVAKNRVLDINPNIEVTTHNVFFMPDTEGIIDDSLDYIVDAVDNVTAKIDLVMRANKLNIPIICSMGTGNKLDPTRFEITDIFKTTVDPLAKVMRKELKSRGVKHLKVLYSNEEPQILETKFDENNKATPASISFVPSVAGLIIAGEVVKDIVSL